MNILITGAEGFVGKNLREWLRLGRPDDKIISCDINNQEDLAKYCGKADFVFHLAGVNRPADISEFETGNSALTKMLLTHCSEGKKPPVLVSSSTQAIMDNPYGKSKKAAEAAAFAYQEQTGSPAYVFRLPGVFGKWCRPDYNSVVATFCHKIAHNQPIDIRDPDFELNLVYIDDVCQAFLAVLDGNAIKNENICVVEPVHSIKLGVLAEILRSFRHGRENLNIADMSNPLKRKLYSTYLSYLTDFSYPLVSHSDERGSFTEFFKTDGYGQISVNVAKPGVTKGNHWHHTKTEKFLVVSGQGVIRLRKILEKNIIEYPVNGDVLRVVDIPPGYVHSIVNTGSSDLVTVIWASDVFDPLNPDTFFEKVQPET